MKKTRLQQGGGSKFLAFWCPGCDDVHSCRVRTPDGAARPSWEWNGDRDRPTLNPSVLVRGKRKITDDEHQRIMAGEAVDVPDFTCHLFLKDGQLQFLTDSTHDLAGKTVPMPDLPDWLQV